MFVILSVWIKSKNCESRCVTFNFYCLYCKLFFKFILYVLNCCCNIVVALITWINCYVLYNTIIYYYLYYLHCILYHVILYTVFSIILHFIRISCTIVQFLLLWVVNIFKYLTTLFLSCVLTWKWNNLLSIESLCSFLSFLAFYNIPDNFSIKMAS